MPTATCPMPDQQSGQERVGRSAHDRTKAPSTQRSRAPPREAGRVGRARTENRRSRHVSARSGYALYHPDAYGIAHCDHDDGNADGDLLCGAGCGVFPRRGSGFRCNPVRAAAGETVPTWGWTRASRFGRPFPLAAPPRRAAQRASGAPRTGTRADSLDDLVSPQ